MPKDTFTHTTVTVAPLARVWASLDEPSTWEEVGGVDRVTDAVVEDDGRLRGFSFEVSAAGKPYRGVAKPRERHEEQLMAWDVDTAEVKGVTSVALRPLDEGTEITVMLEVESKGFLSSMFFPVIASAVGTGLPRSVDEFAARFA